MGDVFGGSEMFHLLELSGIIEARDEETEELHSEGKVAEKMREIFHFHGIMRSDLRRELSDEDKRHIRHLIDGAYILADDDERKAKRLAIPGVSSLSTIRDLSNHLLDSTNLQNMEGRWAEDYYGGYFAKRKAQIEKALAEGKTAASTGQGGYNNEGGASYYVRTLRAYRSRVMTQC